MENKVTVAVGYNPMANRMWLAAQIVRLVKEGTEDIYIVNSDQRIAGDVIATVRDMTKDDAAYQEHMMRHNIQIHQVASDDIEELNEAKPVGRSALLVNNILTFTTKALSGLRKHNMPVYATTTPAGSKGIVDEDVSIRFI